MKTRNQSKSRHTALKGKVTRSFGEHDGQDLVVELSEDGIEVRLEPLGRRIKRNEELPNIRVDPAQLVESGAPGNLEEQARELAWNVLHDVASKVRIADFENKKPHMINYSMQVWLRKKLLQALKDRKEEFVE